MKAKKLLLKLMVVILAVIGLSSCKTKEKIQLEIWNYYTNYQKNLFESMVDTYNQTRGKEKNITITPVSKNSISVLVSDVKNSINKVPGSAALPNMFFAYAGLAYFSDQSNVVAGLDPYFTSAELDEYIPSYIEEGRFDANKSLKMFPVAKAMEIMAFNEQDLDKFTKAVGINNIAERIETVDGLIEVSKLYYEWTDNLTPDILNDGKSFYGRDSMSNYFVCGARQLGLDLMSYDEDGNFHVNYDRNVMKKLWELYYVPYVKGYFYSSAKFRSTDINLGKILGYTGSTSSINFFPDSVKVSDTESYAISPVLFPAPRIAGGENISVQQGAGIVVTKNTKSIETACTDFIKWFTSEQNNITFSKGTSYLPVKKTAMEAENYKNSEDNALVTRVFDICSSQINSTTLYTNVPSTNSEEIRENVLDTILSNFAVNKRNQYLTELAGNPTDTTIIEKYISEDVFNEWYESLVTSINKYELSMR